MGLTFTKKKPSAAVGTQAEETKAETKKPAAASSTAKSETKTGAPKLGFMKSGASAKQALASEEAKAEAAKDAAGKMWRFWMPEGSDRKITFLDGNLDAEGMLDINMYYDHTVQLNGKWHNFVCTAEADQSQPCPLCAAGDKPSLVGVMTIIDHSEHVVQNGPNAGKTIKDTRKLFVCKRATIKQLSKLAVKRGGLTGCTFDVSRSDDKKPNVGDVFDFTKKYAKRSDIMEEYDLKEEDVQPADYEEEIVYLSPEKLIELGAAKAKTNSGGGSYGGGSKTSGQSYKNDL